MLSWYQSTQEARKIVDFTKDLDFVKVDSAALFQRSADCNGANFGSGNLSSSSRTTTTNHDVGRMRRYHSIGGMDKTNYVGCRTY